MTDNETSRGDIVDPAGQPSPVDTGRGLSVLYGDRYLYSRFDPSKNINLQVSALEIKPETLVLCFSPILGYGLDVILGKLPDSSFALAVEADENLMALSLAHIEPSVLNHVRFRYVRSSAPEAVVEYLDKLGVGPFRRCLRVDLSGGSALYGEVYSRILADVDEYISRFWRNRITLMKLGRNYARNFFRNIPALKNSEPLTAASCGKPILVAGAGPSLETSARFIREERDSIFVLAVDAALPSLRELGIEPDAVVLVESQYWIEKAFIGFAGSRIPLYADLTARPGAVRALGGAVHFFHTEYAEAEFLKRFSMLCETPLSVPPLGSVGLTAIFLAKVLAAPNMPVFFTGLDFSWGSGFTHAKGTPATRAGYDAAGKMTTLEIACADRAFADGVARVGGKKGFVLTDTILASYAELCGRAFGDDRRVYDIGSEGLATGCARMSEETARDILRETSLRASTDGQPAQAEKMSERDDIARFIECERVKLSMLRDILSGEKTEESAGATIEELVREMDYLFLHFPDGHKGYSDSPAFLKRVRIEIDYFLKTIEHST